MTSPIAGRYQLQARLGQGATGVVYEAIDPDRGRHVAVKVMLPDVAQDAPARQHFLREARAVSRLRHRHLAAVYDVAGNDEPPYVAMERLRGRTLAERQTMSPPLTLAESLEIVEQVCLGLQCAHEHGLVHRHVTPANIWLLEDGSVKVVDFGLPATAAPTVTDSRLLVGRVAYLAPEQVAGKPADGRADIFAAGVILFELITGRRPWDAESITGIFDQVVNLSPAPVLAMIPTEAERVDEIVRRALAKDPHTRYQDALEMAGELTLARLELIAGAKVVEEDTAPLPVLPVAEAPTLQPRGLIQPLDESTEPEMELTYTSTGQTGYELAAPSLFRRIRAAAEAQNPIVLVSGGATVALLALLVAFFTLRTPTAKPQTPATGAASDGPARSSAAPAPPPVVELRIETQPADAEVFVNGASLGARTPLTTPVDRLRNAEIKLVKPGYDPLTVRPTADDLAKPTLSFPLVAEAPPIVVTGSAPFPFEVVNGRTVVSRAAPTHRFTIRGAQTLRVRAPDYFLDRAVAIPAGRPAVTLYVPALGRLSVRTSPSLERCHVSIGGRDFGTPAYPPVPFQSIVSGPHVVRLTCPDGSVHDQTVTVEADRDRAAVFR